MTTTEEPTPRTALPTGTDIWKDAADRRTELIEAGVPEAVAENVANAMTDLGDLEAELVRAIDETMRRLTEARAGVVAGFHVGGISQEIVGSDGSKIDVACARRKDAAHALNRAEHIARIFLTK